MGGGPGGAAQKINDVNGTEDGHTGRETWTSSADLSCRKRAVGALKRNWLVE